MMVQYKFLTPFHSVFLFVLFSKLCVAALDMSYWWVYFGYGNRIPIFLNIEKVVYAISEGGMSLRE